MPLPLLPTAGIYWLLSFLPNFAPSAIKTRHHVWLKKLKLFARRASSTMKAH